MTFYQQAIAIGGIIEGDGYEHIQTFDDINEALEAFERYTNE